MKSVGFKAIEDKDARVLLLGSLPGRMSLQKGEYYGQPHNVFWPIMGTLAGALPELPYQKRSLKLIQHHIALWDVCAAGAREGSLDSAIDMKTIETNDFAEFFRTHKQIRLICFNGAKAADIYIRRVLPGLPAEAQAIERRILPSTSPAHAGMKFEMKLAHWRAALSSH
jgi:hypoxanthine-DNA glycosylase